MGVRSSGLSNSSTQDWIVSSSRSSGSSSSESNWKRAAESAIRSGSVTISRKLFCFGFFLLDMAKTNIKTQITNVDKIQYFAMTQIRARGYDKNRRRSITCPSSNEAFD